MARLAVFVDGWNFYWSLDNADLKPYGWCNFALLAQQQTGLSNATVNVKYFTSADKPHPEKILDRQTTIWWRALRYLGVQIVEGEFRSTRSEVEQQIRHDGRRWREKQTDIALASHMIADCGLITPDPDRSGAWLWTPGYDEAVLLSGDSDFVPAVNILVDEPFRRRIHILLPPSSDVAQANALQIWKPLSGPNLHIVQLTKADLVKALLPQVVTNADGEKVKCHHSWMWRDRRENPQQLRTPAAKIPDGRPEEKGGSHWTKT
jgi:hypothetical protein